MLSQASRLVLIKSVLAVDHVYPLSSFRAPKQVTDKINSRFVNLFWGFNNNVLCMHLTRANWLFRPRDLGGLGCRRTTLVNQALLAKHSWRFLMRPNALPSRWARSKYITPGIDLSFKRTLQDSPV